MKRAIRCSGQQTHQQIQMRRFLIVHEENEQRASALVQEQKDMTDNIVHIRVMRRQEDVRLEKLNVGDDAIHVIIHSPSRSGAMINTGINATIGMRPP